MPMQQTFGQQQPQTHDHVPETMSLQMKIGNAFAQRPTSLPIAPPSPLHQQQQQQQQRQQTRQPLLPPVPQHSSLKNDAGDQRTMERSPEISSPISKRQLNISDNGSSDQAITFILSMEVCCARVSEEVTEMWGYYPQEFAHRSLYDFISPKDTDRLARLHRLLLDNIVDVAKRQEPPTQTERTTSEVFHKMDQEQLTTIAPGSCTFSDTLHVKKRSGEEELYEMIVCMGGGLGADLHKTDSHAKLYIIAQFRKHRYQVSVQNAFEPAAPSRLVASSFSQTGMSKSKETTNNKSSNPCLKKSFAKTNSNNPPFRHMMARTITDIGRMGAPDMRSRSTLPAHYATSSQLNTISKIEPAKVNVAPITQQRSSPSFSTSLTSTWQNRLGTSSFTAHHDRRRSPSGNNNADSDASSSSSSSSFTPPTSTASQTSTFPSAPLSSARESRYSTLAYRFAPLPPTKMFTGAPRGGPNVTHPATQYFLQTSSSTLNAAASAAQYSSRHKYHSTSSMADNDKASGKTDSNRKVEMSIRSLLC